MYNDKGGVRTGYSHEGRVGTLFDDRDQVRIRYSDNGRLR